jgi:hypothetical protein
VTLENFKGCGGTVTAGPFHKVNRFCLF